LNKQGQSGNSTLIAVILVLVLGVAALAGWYVWDRNKLVNNNSTNNTQQANTEKANNQTSNTENDYGYLELSEYRVRIPLNEDTKGLKLGSIKSSTYNQNDKLVAIIAPELDNSWSCTQTEDYKGTIGNISITSQIKRSGPYDPLVTKKLGDITYGYEQAGTNCTKESFYQTLVDEFKNQFQKIEVY
jgi:hypothetical protein